MFKLTTFVVIGTECTVSWKSNYHTIMTMTAPETSRDNIWHKVCFCPHPVYIEAWIVAYHPFWLKSDLWLVPIYWYVGAREIWGNSITGHMRVTLCTIQWKWWLWDGEGVQLLCILQAIRLIEKDHTRIYHIIIYSWHKVSLIWPVMGFLQISHAAINQ